MIFIILPRGVLLLEDLNTAIYKTQYLYERATLWKRLEEQESLISRARKLLVADKLKFDDFSKIKEEYRIDADPFSRSYLFCIVPVAASIIN